VSQRQIEAAMELEWDRRYITVLGVANKRLYEFRLQTAQETYPSAKVGPNLFMDACVPCRRFASAGISGGSGSEPA